VGSGTTLVYGEQTDIGRRRANNQDSLAVVPPVSPQQYQSRGWLLLVADGMGAHVAGERASKIAAEQVPLIYEKNAQRSPPLALLRSLEQANSEINLRGRRQPEYLGMGTTCTTLVVVPRGVLVGHVGDSRAYRLRGTTLDQLTRDHSAVWELESQGGLTREQAERTVGKNVITRSMGPHARVEVDIEGPHSVEQGDVYLLCSDGLSGQVADEEIGLFLKELPPRDACAALVGLTLVRGAPDNVTVIVAKAGAEEVSANVHGAPAWALDEDYQPRSQKQQLPWKQLAIAAGSLLIALLLSPWGDFARSLGDLPRTICSVASAAALLVMVAMIVMAFVGFALPAGDGRSLASGSRLGQGPYRTYNCSPRAALVEGIVASAESAADGLAPPECDRMLAAATRARKFIAAGSFHEATVAAAEAIAVYSRSVEEARSGDTLRAPPPSPPGGHHHERG
jgi:protein phosphatase